MLISESPFLHSKCMRGSILLSFQRCFMGKIPFLDHNNISQKVCGSISLLILSFNDCAHYNTLTHLSTKLCTKKIFHKLTPITFCEKKYKHRLYVRIEKNAQKMLLKLTPDAERFTDSGNLNLVKLAYRGKALG